VWLAACGGSPSEQPAASATAPAADPATAASLSGQVTLDGTPPAPEIIRLDGDPKCLGLAPGEERHTEDFVVGSGGALQNVFVYVKDGLPQQIYPVPRETVVLDQEKCQYKPHVLGLQVGQTLQIRNSDAILHNVHGEGAVNRAFDIGQPIKGITNTHVFTTREVMVPVKCNVHAWMNAFIGVVEHPYFAVSDSSGRFSIPQLPPGTYTLEAWHERLGLQAQQITVGPKEAKAVAFTFKVS